MWFTFLFVSMDKIVSKPVFSSLYQQYNWRIMSFYPLEYLMNLYNGYQRTFKIAGKSYLLIQDSERHYLLLNQCPHQLRPLDNATISGGTLTCPFHGMCFDLTTGKTEDGCRNRLERLDVAYEGNQLGVYL